MDLVDVIGPPVRKERVYSTCRALRLQHLCSGPRSVMLGPCGGRPSLRHRHRPVGRIRAISRSHTAGPNRKELVGLLTDDPATVLHEGAQITEVGVSAVTPVPMLGHVTSSYYSPTLKRSIAMALVRSGQQRSGQQVQIPLADGRTVRATVGTTVFYDPEGKRHHV